MWKTFCRLQNYFQKGWMRPYEVRSTLNVNSSSPRQNGRHFADNILKCIFMNERLGILIKISLKFVPKGLNGNKSELVQACCLTALGHYLNQCWPTINEILWHPFQVSSTWILKIWIPKLCLKFTHQNKMRSNQYLPGRNEFKTKSMSLPPTSQWHIVPHHWLTHWGRDKMVAIFQTTFSNAFSWMKMFKFRLKFHWSLFPRVQLTIFQHWFRWWLGAGQATSHYLKQWWFIDA